MTAVPATADIVIVGAGPAGLMMGALLTKAGRSVCLLEAESFVGGRAATIVDAGFTFEIGPHAAMDYRLRDVYAELGLTFERGGQNVGWHLAWDGEWRRFQDFVGTQRDVHARIVDAMEAISYEDLARFDAMSAMDWVDQFGADAELRFAYEDLIVNEMVLTRGDECSAAEWIYIHKIALDGEGRFGWADYPIGGYSAMLAPLEQYILDGGGTIVDETRAIEIVIDGGRATGVRYVQGQVGYASNVRSSAVVDANTVIYTAPIGTMAGVLRPDDVPEWYRTRLHQLHANKTGILGFYEGHEGSLMGPEIRTWWGEGTNLPSFAISVSEYEPSTAPDGMSLTWFGMYYRPEDNSPAWRLDDIVRTFEAEAEAVMPELRTGSAWRSYYASLDYQAVAQRPGFTGIFKPEVKVPEVEGLFIAGDGVRGGRGVGVENVAGSAFRCRDAIADGLTRADLAAIPVSVRPGL